MLQLKNITKDYKLGDGSVQKALKGISINFRKSEFVAILGPSGCGKTTTLNIIGGLDHYTAGDLMINGVSTKNFKDRDWDDYRNKSIGFVFQSYNLIPHQNVLNNVAMGLTLAGVKQGERARLAKEALEKVGLGNSLKKKPNQLSGGQMQRVAIARALVGNPDIILADEPTGALDSETGVQVMEILKEIAKEKLVIMVTHNGDLANAYANRIISIFDGELVNDSHPYTDQDLAKDSQKTTAQADVETAVKKKKVSMSLGTAFGLSGQTLKEKKGRTFITSFAGSIGIFAITLILAISAGMSAYVNNMQKSALGTNAITISADTYSIDLNMQEEKVDLPAYARDTSVIYPYTPQERSPKIHNDFTDEFLDYIDKMDKSLTSTIEYTYDAKMNIITNTAYGYQLLTGDWEDGATQIISNYDLITDNYDVLYKKNATGLPSNKNELTLVVDKYNRLTTESLDALGIDYNANLDEITFESLMNKEFKWIPNNVIYTANGDGTYAVAGEEDYETLYNSSAAETLQIIGIVRVKNDDAVAWLSTGIVYSSELTKYVMDDAKNSNVVAAQMADKTKDIIKGTQFVDKPFNTAEEQYQSRLEALGVVNKPSSINLYPASINDKDAIVKYLDDWNKAHPDNEITYSDLTQMIMSMLSSLINIISYVLVGFCAVSLVVSTVMISVTTYTSVVERTKEIGVLRSLGARKKDISRIFNAETIIIGGLAGMIGVLFAMLVGSIANAVLNVVVGVGTIVSFNFGTSVLMIALSTVLTWIAGLIPASIAAKKDPVLCLRTE